MAQARLPRIAVLGAGIMGSATALFLARKGCAVTIYERSGAAMAGASRWNEGKIHRGFLYAADASLRTARELMPGGMSFKRLIEELIETPIDAAISQDDDVYLVHPDSLVGAAAMRAYFDRVAELIASFGGQDYLVPNTPVRALSARELKQYADGPVKAGFRVPERSVNTRWLADRIVNALRAEPRIDVRAFHRVEHVQPCQGNCEGPWRVHCDAGTGEPYDVVINALWDGRLAIDARLDIAPRQNWSHRHRLALFVKTDRPLQWPSVVLATGPFGDVKNYDGRHFYLSWYPAGLVAEGEDISPPEFRMPPPHKVIESTREGLARCLPQIKAIFDHAAEIEIEGGWVFAQGRGPLADPAASLHRRDSFGISRKGTYFSIDTGKYSSAPLLARRIADHIVDRADLVLAP